MKEVKCTVRSECASVQLVMATKVFECMGVEGGIGHDCKLPIVLTLQVLIIQCRCLHRLDDTRFFGVCFYNHIMMHWCKQNYGYCSKLFTFFTIVEAITFIQVWQDHIFLRSKRDIDF